MREACKLHRASAQAAGAGPDRAKLLPAPRADHSKALAPHTNMSQAPIVLYLAPEQPRLRPGTVSGGITLYLQGRQMSQGRIGTRPEPAGRHHSNQA